MGKFNGFLKVAFLATFLFVIGCSSKMTTRDIASIDLTDVPKELIEEQDKIIKEFLKPGVGEKVQKAFDDLSAYAGPAETTARILAENVQSWWARWKMLNDAKESIYTTYFILKKDIFGKAFLALIRKKAEEGIKIRFMVDARGTKYYTRGFYNFAGGKDYLQEIINTNPTNVDVAIYNPKMKQIAGLLMGDIKRLIASNHDKIIIVDSRYTLTGGRNISQNYFASPLDDPEVFRDTDILMDEGVSARNDKHSLVSAMKKAISAEINYKKNDLVRKDRLGNWNSKKKEMEFYRVAMDLWMQGEDIKHWWQTNYPKDLKIEKRSTRKGRRKEQKNHGKRYRTKYIKGLLKLPRLVEMKFRGKTKTYKKFQLFNNTNKVCAKILDKNSLLADKNQITNSIMKLIDSSEKEIIIQNPYVVLTRKARKALQAASDRGVKIIIHTNSPKSTDSLLTQAFFVKDWKNILKKMKNLEIWAFTGINKLHAKVFVFDRKVAIIGTYNMDPMSEQINSEIVAAIKKPEFAMRVALGITSKIHGDFVDSKQFEIKIKEDGTVTVIYGPMDTIKDNKRLTRIMKLLQNDALLKLLAPII